MSLFLYILLMPVSLSLSLFLSLDLSELAKAAKKKLQAVSNGMVLLYFYIRVERIIKIMAWLSFPLGLLM